MCQECKQNEAKAEEEKSQNDDDDGDDNGDDEERRRSMCERLLPPFSDKQCLVQRHFSEPSSVRIEMISWFCPTTSSIRISTWSVGRAVGQPWRRPACPSSVASRRTMRTLYLASRRLRASAALKPPADSQLTPTVSIFAEILFLLLCIADELNFVSSRGL